MNRPQADWFRLLAKHNPFYLLSAACMLAGCLALTNSLSWTSIALPRLLILMATINIYEAALIGLGLYLIVRRGQIRDGRILLVLEAFFLVDTSFLNAEIVTAHYTLGLILNAVLLILAAVKIGIALHVLKPDFSPMQYAFVLVQIFALLALPAVLRAIDHGTIAPTWFYGGWWLLGLLPALYELFIRTTVHRDRKLRFATQISTAAPVRLYLVLPWLSLMLHVSILHYVYDVHFYGANAAPVLLALTIAMYRAAPSRLIPRRDLTVLQLLLPLAAVFVSLNNPDALHVTLFHRPLLSFSPLALAALGAYLTYVYCFLSRHAILFLATAAGALVIGKFGPSSHTVWKGVAMSCQWLFDFTNALVPKTLTQWGVLSVALSFLFLAIGAAISLHRPVLIEAEADAPDELP